MIRPTIRTTEKGGKLSQQILKALRQLNEGSVTVGVHGDAGSYPDEDVTVGQVALWNEFGTFQSPARPFLRPAIDNHRDLLNKWRDELVGAVMGGKMVASKALAALGTRVVALVDRQIASNTPPPLSRAYAAWKIRQGKPARTLILTGLMRRSLSFKVHNGLDGGE